MLQSFSIGEGGTLNVLKNLVYSLSCPKPRYNPPKYNEKTVLLRDTVHQISWGESAAAGLTAGQHRPVYIPVNLTSLNVSNSRFQKPVMFWRWRHHCVASWRHGRGAWHNCLLLPASNVNSWADVANHVTQLWQAGDTENFERRITG